MKKEKKRACKSCKYYKYENYECYCDNEESDYYSLECEEEDRCEDYEEKE